MNIRPEHNSKNNTTDPDEKVKTLINENNHLKDNIDSLITELNSLKDQLAELSPNKKLPDHIKVLFSKIDEFN
ncbi:hypothetical protein BpHYR1_033572 [Brachionus plicatilis]|uniref:Uncharacterized protein n=1 Tax=Brachionus plicatilis TaxID=10195 RepID=A0A3M7RXY8_BRAPC|nr:hypothetical protein BpHYR1_033572 [Brachionus plicatilis]